MREFEFRVVPAPVRAMRLRGLSRKDDAFCATLSQIINEEGRDGWEFLRGETLAVRRGIWPFRSSTSMRQVLVFRRAQNGHAVQFPSMAERRKARDAEPVAPRRVRNADAVDRVRDGARRITVADAETDAPEVIAAE